MSSEASNSNEAGEPPDTSALSRTSLVLVIVAMGLLLVLVWAFSPPRPGFQPASLQTVSSHTGCPRGPAHFIPTNITEVPELGLDKLPHAVRSRVLLRLNLEPCPRGCNLSIAACLAGNPACRECKELGSKIMASEQADTHAAPQ